MPDAHTLEPQQVFLDAPIGRRQLEQGLSFRQWVESAGEGGSRLMRRYDRSQPPTRTIRAYQAFARRGGRVYALAEAWCGDCAYVVPALSRLCDQAGVELRIFPRDQHPDLRDRHLTGGRAKIPLVVAVLPDGTHPERLVETGRFVERPALANRRMQQGDMRVYASQAVEEALWAELEATAGGGWEPWTVSPRSGGQTPIRASLHLPAGVTPSLVAVVAHGSSYDQNHPLSYHFCQRLAQRGVGAVRFDFSFRAEGRPGWPDGEREAADMDAVVKATAERLGLGSERILLAGKSVGAYASVRLASQDVYAGVVAFGYPFHGPGRPDQSQQGALAGLKAPLLLFSGRQDPLADPAVVEREFARVATEKEMVWLEGADHSLQGYLGEVLDRAVSWALNRAQRVAASAG